MLSKQNEDTSREKGLGTRKEGPIQEGKETPRGLARMSAVGQSESLQIGTGRLCTPGGMSPQKLNSYEFEDYERNFGILWDSSGLEQVHRKLSN